MNRVGWAGLTLLLCGLPALAYGGWIAFVRLCDFRPAGPAECSPLVLAAPYLVLGAGLLVAGAVLLIVGAHRTRSRLAAEEGPRP